MKPACLSILFLALAAPCATLAATPDFRDSLATRSGAYTVNFHVNLASALPAGATIVCKAQIAPGQAGAVPLPWHLAAAPVEAATGLAAVTGSTAACAVEIPFSWTGAGAESGVLLSYEIDAVRSGGTTPLLVESRVEQGIRAPLPSPGGHASLTVDVRF